jgi:hypothetical protein
MEAQVKQCKKCNEIKPLEDFYRDRTRKDGREWMCKRCKEAYKKEKRERKRRVIAAQTTPEIKPEPKETIFMPKLQEEYKCSFCGEIRKRPIWPGTMRMPRSVTMDPISARTATTGKNSESGRAGMR